MAFRFVHTADIHLDSPLRSLALRNPALSDLIATATRTAFERIIDLCLDEAVDALLIAGDLYDGQQTSMKTARFLGQQFQRLSAAGIAVCIIRGNHDALSKITKELVLPDNVTVFGAQAGVRTFHTGTRPVAVHGVSFAKPHAPDSLLDRFDAPVPGAINIAMLHTSLGGAIGHDPYAPCAVPDLMTRGFDYWALGHVHIRAVHQGRACVVMPGMPQARDIGEAGAKSVTLGDIADDGTVSLQERSVAVAQFERLPLDLSHAADWPTGIRHLEQMLRQARRDHGADHLVIRPMLHGGSALCWQTQRDADLLLAEAEAVGDSIGSLWIDKIENHLTAQRDTHPAQGPMSDLATLMQTGALHDPAREAEAAQITEELLRALPRDLRGLFGDTPDATATLRDTLLQEGATEVLARFAPDSDAAGQN